MLSRTVVGAGAGALAGIGLALTLDGLRRSCHVSTSRVGCGRSGPLLFAPILVFWMLVAGALIYAGFRMGRVARGWRVTGIGSGLWAVLIVTMIWFRTAYLDAPLADGHSLPKEYGHNFMLVAVVVSACAAYLAAASFAGRERTE
jgi:hypothetical protein